jgi:hypothetical protein
MTIGTTQKAIGKTKKFGGMMVRETGFKEGKQMRYAAGGVQIVCPCCRHDMFDKDHRKLNSRAATFFGLDWANRNATILVCQRCSHIAWFMEEPVEIERPIP